uniref:IBB domain-containing protein n=1 Tax=Heterorhabditis bacteriophora TaxID=37862 RepID=A0A1I7XH99_HETBA
MRTETSMMASPIGKTYVTNRRAKVAKNVHYSQPSNSDSDDQNILNETFEEVDGLRMNQSMQERHRRMSSRVERDVREKEQKDRAQKLNRIKNSPNDDAKSKSIVHQLLEAQRRTKIAVTNCFDHQTVLDIIGSGCVEKETMQDMAVAIDTASMVYGFRVDKTHIDAQDTRITFIKGKQGSTKAKAYDLENEDNEQSSSREQFVIEGNDGRKEEKEKTRIKRMKVGKMLIEDEDVLEMASEEYIENDYYQRVSYHFFKFYFYLFLTLIAVSL